MASGPQVGTAWVAITPSFRGFASGVQSGLAKEVSSASRAAGEAAGKDFSSGFESATAANPPEPAWNLGAVGAAAGAAVAVGFGASMAATMDVSTATNRLTAQLDLTAAEAERAGDVAADVFSSGFGESIGEATEAVGAVASSIGDLADLTDAQLADMSKQALGLADVFETDVADSTHAVGQLIKTGLVADASDGFDLIAGTLQQIPAALRDDLLPTIAEYSTQFRDMGLTGQEAMSLMIQGVEAGARDIDVVADAIKEFSIEAVAGSEKTAEGFEMVGLDADRMFELIGQGGDSATEALALTLDALRDIEDPIERNEAATELFGTKAEDLGDALYALDPTVDVLDDVAGSAADLTSTLEDDPARVFSSSVRSLTTSLTTALAPALSAVAGWASRNQGAITAFAIAIGTAAVAVVAVSAAMKVYQTTALAIRAATVAWTAVQWVLNAALMANPLGLVILAVAALIAIVVAAIVYWEEISAAISAAWEGIKTATSAAWEWITGVIGGAWEWITGLFSALNPAPVVAGIWGAIRSTTTTVWNAISGAISTVWGAIRRGISTALSTIRTIVSGAWTALRTTTTTAFTRIRTSITSAFTRAINSLRNVGSRFVSIGRDIIAGIVRGITQAAGRIGGAIKSAAAGAVNVGKSILGIGSPSKLFRDEIGRWIPAGIEVGVEAGTPALTRSLERMVQIPEPPAVRAAVVGGTSAAPAPLIIRADGGRASRAIVEILQHAVRTDLGGDVGRLAGR